jgi:hypothetical protein
MIVLAMLVVNDIRVLNSDLVLKYEDDHVFNMRPGRILACGRFES